MQVKNDRSPSRPTTVLVIRFRLTYSTNISDSSSGLWAEHLTAGGAAITAVAKAKANSAETFMVLFGDLAVVLITLSVLRLIEG